jgi:hypothetical protein
MCGVHNHHCFIPVDEVEERRIDCPERESGVVEAAAHAGPSLLLLSLSVACCRTRQRIAGAGCALSSHFSVNDAMIGDAS